MYRHYYKYYYIQIEIFNPEKYFLEYYIILNFLEYY